MRWMTLLTLLALLLPAVPVRAGAAENPPADISALVKQYRDLGQMTGMAAVVLRGDKIIASGAAGLRITNRPDPLSVGDQFHLGGATKAMTATLCAVLVEQGKLKWDTTVGEVFAASWPVSADMAWRPVTLKQLLSNRAGLPEDRSPPMVFVELRKMTDQPLASRRKLMEDRLADAPSYVPGAKVVMANAGFSIAAHMAETITSKTYEELMSELLFKPLKMDSAGFGPPMPAPGAPQPWGHDATGLAIDPNSESADQPSASNPAGRVRCTLADWAKFVSLHLAGERGEKRLLTPASVKALHEVLDPSGATMGWTATRMVWSATPVLVSSGTNGNWYALAWVSPIQDIAFLIATNRGGGKAAAEGLAQALVARYTE
jgi:D-alanyl-D-alanine carboxypeptidase